MPKKIYSIKYWGSKNVWFNTKTNKWTSRPHFDKGNLSDTQTFSDDFLKAFETWKMCSDEFVLIELERAPKGKGWYSTVFRKELEG